MSRPLAWTSGVERWVWRVLAAVSAYFALVVVRAGPTDPLLLAAGGGIAVVVVRMLLGRVDLLDVGLLGAALLVALGADLLGTPFPQPRPGFLVLVVLVVTVLSLPRSPRTTLPLAVGAGATYAALASGAPVVVTLEVLNAAASGIGAAVVNTGLRRSAARSDEALAEREAVAARRADVDAAEQARSEVHRLLHDELVATLSLLRLDPERRTAVAAAREALHRLDAFGEGAGAGAPRPEVWPDHGLDLVVEDHRDGEGDRDEVPQAVWAAVAGAAGEALRNVGRHAGVEQARLQLSSTAGGGVRVEVHDDGIGFDPARTPGFGLRSSVRARMQEVGGVAEVRSAPGEGTHVSLSWSPATDAGDDRTEGRDRWLRLRDALGDLPFLVVAFPLAQVLVGLALVVSLPGPRPLASWALGVAVASGTLALAWRAALGPLGPATTLAATPAPAAAIVLGLWLAGPGALRGFESWIVGLAEVPVIVLALVAPRAAAYTSMALASGTVLAVAVVDPTVSPGEVVGPIVQPTMYGLVFSLLGWSVLRIGAVAARAHEETLAAVLDEARSRQRSGALRSRLRGLDARARLLLSAAVTQPLSPEDGVEAGLLAAAMRDELVAPDALDDAARDLLQGARRSGADVVLRPGLDASHRPHLAAVLLRSLAPYPTLGTVVLGPGPGPADVRVTVWPPEEPVPTTAATDASG